MECDLTPEGEILTNRGGGLVAANVAEGRPDREALLALTLLDLVNTNAPAKLRRA